MKVKQFKPIFVKYIPDVLNEGYLYISIDYSTAIHLCACGCGERVVTPLSNNDWTLHYNGKVSLSPSIGNFEYQCNSHYFIKENHVVWCDNYGRKDKKKKMRRSFTWKFWTLLW